MGFPPLLARVLLLSSGIFFSLDLSGLTADFFFRLRHEPIIADISHTYRFVLPPSHSAPLHFRLVVAPFPRHSSVELLFA
ncbi:hypothetical protein BJX63DRAFT_164134 [Aspergillus granulosus]|uniref:Secreted protein n=1 Tax=Aspergillus granulosus TaxID=176169 RepID=A0ABR4HIN4_9EURO